jgi:hypothetical protein
MNDLIFQKTEGAKTVKIFLDFDPESPRSWDNLGEILYKKNSRYVLGDRELEIEDLHNAENDNDYIILPVYAYIHSTTVLNTTGFSCPWDSGQCGVIRVSKAKVLKEYGWKRLSKKRIEKIKGYLKNEIEIYSQYLQGAVYGFVMEDLEGNEIDSCWGFYESPEALADQALKDAA